jgi:O-antigen/teichoic acid export membrane protein
MMDDPAELERRVEYLDALRSQGRSARLAGFVACLAGVLILVVGRYRLGGAIWALWSGSAVIALGWALFIYAIGRRLYWARAHPYPNAAKAP